MLPIVLHSTLDQSKDQPLLLDFRLPFSFTERHLRFPALLEFTHISPRNPAKT
jgi:hypothetical protein